MNSRGLKWRIQRLPNAGVPVWAYNPCAKIKQKLISSMQMHLNLPRHVI